MTALSLSIYLFASLHNQIWIVSVHKLEMFRVRFLKYHLQIYVERKILWRCRLNGSGQELLEKKPTQILRDFWYWGIRLSEITGFNGWLCSAKKGTWNRPFVLMTFYVRISLFLLEDYTVGFKKGFLWAENFWPETRYSTVGLRAFSFVFIFVRRSNIRKCSKKSTPKTGVRHLYS